MSVYKPTSLFFFVFFLQYKCVMVKAKDLVKLQDKFIFFKVLFAKIFFLDF